MINVNALAVCNNNLVHGSAAGAHVLNAGYMSPQRVHVFSMLGTWVLNARCMRPRRWVHTSLTLGACILPDLIFLTCTKRPMVTVRRAMADCLYFHVTKLLCRTVGLVKKLVMVQKLTMSLMIVLFWCNNHRTDDYIVIGSHDSAMAWQPMANPL